MVELLCKKLKVKNQISDAIGCDNVKQVRSLLSEHWNKEEIYLAGNQDNTLLHEACIRKRDYSYNNDDRIKFIIKELIDYGYNVDAQNDNKDTPFHYINAEKVHPEPHVLGWFFERGVSPNMQNEQGDTPFHYLLQGKNPVDEQEERKGYSSTIIKLFLENNANPNIQNDQGDTPFHFMCRLNDFGLIKLFFGKADSTKQNNDGDTPFHFICRNIAQKTTFTIDQIEQFFEKNKEANPNIQNNIGNTPYHHITEGEYRPDFIKLFLIYGAHEYILNNAGKTPYRLGLDNVRVKKRVFRVTRNEDRDWHHIKNRVDWQEYKNDLPQFIKKRFRYYAFEKAHDNDFINNDQHTITMVAINDIDYQANKDYYDPKDKQFKRIMKFAQEYITAYNKKKRDNEKNKILHLLSFSWQSNMIASAKQLAKYLDKEYRNSRLIFLAGGFGCDVANLASYELGVLDQINAAIKIYNEGNPDNKKSYKARIKLFISVDPLYRHVIPEEAKSLFINPAGMLYDALNNAISTKPTNFQLLLTLYSSRDKGIKPNAFSNEMNAVTQAIVGIGGLMLYAGGENLIEEGVTPSTLLLGGAGGMTISYALWSKQNKEKTIANLSHHRNENVVPINEPNGDSFIIEGPKICLKIMMRDEYIGYSASALLKNLSSIYTTLKQEYPVEVEQGGRFCVNTDVGNKIQILIDKDQPPLDILDNRYL